MDPRFITKNMHAFLDYPVALVLLTAPFILGLGDSHPAAVWLSVATGVAALFLRQQPASILGTEDIGAPCAQAGTRIEQVEFRERVVSQRPATAACRPLDIRREIAARLAT